MSYRPWLEERALRQMRGLPAEALDVLVRVLARIWEDPVGAEYCVTSCDLGVFVDQAAEPVPPQNPDT